MSSRVGYVTVLTKNISILHSDQDAPVQLFVLVVRSLARLLVYYQTTAFRETVLSILRTGLISHGEKVLDTISDEIKKVAEFQIRNSNPRYVSDASKLIIEKYFYVSISMKQRTHLPVYVI